jgi:hypothetical protein
MMEMDSWESRYLKIYRWRIQRGAWHQIESTTHFSWIVGEFLTKALLIMAKFSTSEATLQLGESGTTAASVSVETKAGSISFDDNNIQLAGFSGTLLFALKPTGATENNDVSNENTDRHKVAGEGKCLHDGEGGAN